MEGPNRSVTIKHVAQRAGVSTATVSHVINKTRFVSPDLISRVNEAIDELGYYPNVIVGSMRNNKTYTVGLVIPSISNETFGRMAEDIQKILFRSGYNLIICNISNNCDIEHEAYNMLLTKKVDAIISTPTTKGFEKLQEIQNRQIPVVIIDRQFQGFAADTVRVDYRSGTRMVIDYLTKLGHKEIGYIDRKIDQSHSVEQRQAYIDFLREKGINVNPDYIIRASGFDYLSGAEAGKRLMTSFPQITAIFAYYDILALGAMRGVLDLGYRIPNDVSIVGCDNMPVTESVFPRLTTLSMPVQRISEIACDLLLNQLGEQRSSPGEIRNIALIPELMIRESTGVARD